MITASIVGLLFTLCVMVLIIMAWLFINAIKHPEIAVFAMIFAIAIVMIAVAILDGYITNTTCTLQSLF